MALKTGTPVVPAFSVRQKDGRYRVLVERELELQRSGDKIRDIEDNTALFTRIIDKHILAHPDQWFWFHRRLSVAPGVVATVQYTYSLGLSPGAQVQLDGEIRALSAGSTTQVVAQGVASFFGAGLLRLNHSQSRLTGSAGSRILLNGPAVVSSGGGNVGGNAARLDIFGGSIDSQSGTLTFQPPTGGSNSTISVPVVTRSGATTVFSGGPMDLEGALVTAESGGTARTIGVSLSNLTLDVDPGGTAQLQTGSSLGIDQATIDGILTTSGSVGVTGTAGAPTIAVGPTGSVTVQNASTFTINGNTSVALNGPLALNSSGSTTSLVVPGQTTFTGPGPITLNNTGEDLPRPHFLRPSEDRAGQGIPLRLH